MTRKTTIIFIILILALFNCDSYRKNKELISESRKKYKFVEEFLTKYPEENLILIMNFIDNPVNHFDEIKNISQLFSYFEILDRLASTDKKLSNFWFGNFLSINFREKKVTLKEIEILTFLLLSSDGYSGEMLADKYTKLFSKSTDVFISYLSKRSDWKRIVNLLGAGDWQVFKTSAEKLGDSGFEGEFKRFVLAPLDKEGKRIIK